MNYLYNFIAFKSDCPQLNRFLSQSTLRTALILICLVDPPAKYADNDWFWKLNLVITFTERERDQEG